PRVEVLGLGGPWQNLAMVRGWEATNGYNPLRIGLYDRLVAPGEQNWNVSQRQFPPSFGHYERYLPKAPGLTHLVLGAPLQDLPGFAASRPPELMLSGPPVWIYRIPGASPRVSIVSELGTDATRLEQNPSGATDRGEAKIASSEPGRLDVVTTSAAA